VKRSHKIAVGIAAALGLGLGAAAVIAQPGPMGGGMGPQMKGGMHMRGGMGHGPMGQAGAGMGAAQSLMTPEERTALQEKMHDAKTPEERQKLAQSTREEMQKRAKEKGITLPEPHGPRAGFGRQFGPGTK
jgi:hypothetical protein